MDATGQGDPARGRNPTAAERASEREVVVARTFNAPARFVFAHPASEQPMAFFGRYIEATPPSRLVWTNDGGVKAGPSPP